MMAVAGPSQSASSPDRSFPNPSRLRVVDSDSSSRPVKTDAAALQASLVKRAQMQKRAERWMDRMMETTVDRPSFLKALQYLSPQQYLDTIHERHLNSLCSYPTCSNAPLAPYTPHRRFSISTTKRTIKPVQGNAEEGFCSKVCRARSAWIEKGLDEEPGWLSGKGRRVELLEELEEKGDVRLVPEGRRGVVPRKSGTGPAEKEAAPGGRRLVAPSVRSSPADVSGDVTHLSTNKTADLMANLVIHERPTPSTLPIPPSLPPDPEQDPSHPPVDQSIASSNGPVSDLRAARDTPDPRTARASTSLVSAPQKLTSTLLSASRQMGPIPQLPPDSDDDEVDLAERRWAEEESAMGLGWGAEDEETRDLFEEMRAAQELLEAES
ncbi:Rtr1/RPAP2 family-domain-containing protein [Naematelia encephala]|uniref:RNA polymerase II subunit B1 CTD phosphatase RPAP2 homolog n=1 Tax=Naematelia encephala TaxID=71784 RepID=A0A1Y2AG08_9TREE|nr:Rtr1/RPAP2 family-domain-containing protein [Naematelia encephala]